MPPDYITDAQQRAPGDERASIHRCDTGGRVRSEPVWARGEARLPVGESEGVEQLNKLNESLGRLLKFESFYR